MTQSIQQYRARYWLKWLGPWRGTRREALDDAIAASAASRTKHANGEGGTYLSIGCRIHTRSTLSGE